MAGLGWRDDRDVPEQTAQSQQFYRHQEPTLDPDETVMLRVSREAQTIVVAMLPSQQNVKDRCGQSEWSKA